jgi:hypothetical protein
MTALAAALAVVVATPSRWRRRATRPARTAVTTAQVEFAGAHQ